MRIFVQVVDCEGLSAAGRKLRMSTAVISSRVIRLEKKYNLRLLHRTTRSVRPTEEGKLFYDSCKRILEEVDATDSMLAEMRERPAGNLSISVPISVGRQIIAPAVPAFLADHGEIKLRFQATDRVIDLIAEEVDLVVRKGIPQSSSMIQRRLAPDLRIVCGAPGYFKRHGIPQSPDDLKGHNCLLLRFPGSRRYVWQLKNGDGAPDNVRISGTMDSSSSDVLIDWALAGHGLIMKSVWDIADHLESGALVGVLHDHWLDDLTVYALMLPRNPQPTKVRYFVDFLVRLFKDHPAMRFTDPGNIFRA